MSRRTRKIIGWLLYALAFVIALTVASMESYISDPKTVGHITGFIIVAIVFIAVPLTDGEDPIMDWKEVIMNMLNLDENDQ